ncbi:hypothetical protein B5S33_g2993 [[Candida] boidinii]|nr:hypothetical protein B5S33_g2993 [[Candida] boidinii]
MKNIGSRGGFGGSGGGRDGFGGLSRGRSRGRSRGGRSGATRGGDTRGGARRGVGYVETVLIVETVFDRTLTLAVVVAAESAASLTGSENSY